MSAQALKDLETTAPKFDVEARNNPMSDAFDIIAYGRSIVAVGAQDLPEQPLHFAVDELLLDALRGDLGPRMADYANKAFPLPHPSRGPISRGENANGLAKDVLRFQTAKTTIFANSYNYAVNEIANMNVKLGTLAVNYKLEQARSTSLRGYVVNDVMRHFEADAITRDKIEEYLKKGGLNDILVSEATKQILVQLGMEAT